MTRTTTRTVLGVLVCALACASCSSAVRQGTGSSYLIVDNLSAAPGASAEKFGDTLESDVMTSVKTTVGTEQVMVPTVFEDVGKVTLRLAMKDVTLATEPTTNNEITITRYHVRYTRTDGRSTQGVDVPYEFDGAATGTISSQGTALTFVIVRAQAKKEAPLAALVGGGGGLVISTIAEVTFYGRDQTGNSVAVTGKISVSFADWGDPQQ